jgi:hypothetical protein
MMLSGSAFALPTLERLTGGSGCSSSRGEWTTPKASDVERGDCPSERARRTPFLPSQVSMWTTPQARDAKGAPGSEARERGGFQASLPARVQGSAWPTPAARDFKDTGTSPAEFDRNTPGLAACAGGSLNPDWVGRLMGFPDGWTSPPTDGPSAPAKRSPKASRRASRKKGTSDGRG